MSKRRWLKTRYAAAAGALVFIFLLVPCVHLLKTWIQEKPVVNRIPHGYTNDASQLNLTPVDTIIKVPKDREAIVTQLRSVLRYARAHQLKISISGAKHSMGGHTMYPGGIVLDMLPYNHMQFDGVNNILTVGSGALWEDAIRFLDTYDKSIAVMQAFSSFSVGGSLSVNGHGWQKDLPPLAATVQSFTLLKSDGAIVNCSRNQNTELFKLVLGGYGLFGVILDVKLNVTDNLALSYRYIKLHPKNYVRYYKKFITDNPNVNLVFGRLRISEKHFLEEATLNFFEKTNSPPPKLPLSKNTQAQRLVFRGSVNSEYGKRLRWDLESGMNKISHNHIYSRNDLINDNVSLIENKNPASTDLLQEYFIPARHFEAYVAALKSVLKKSELDLLNITIRGVKRDDDSFLNYAREDVFGFVFLFNQKKTKAQEAQMRLLTNALVDLALRYEGTFYLPYRLHIGRDKMRKSYPQAPRFFERKKYYDPDEIFNNKFYQHYR